MKIAILSHPTTNTCGVNNVVREQVKILEQNYHVINLKLVYTEAEKRYGNIRFGRSKTYFNFNRLFLPVLKTKLGKLTDQLKECDIVISHAYPMCMVGAQLNKNYRIPHVYIHHGYNTGPVSLSWKTWMRVDRLGTKYSFLHTNKVLSISEYIQKQLKEYFHQESDVLYNGIDIDKFNPKNRDPKIKEKIGIRDAAPFFFNVGHIEPAKGTEYVIKAFHQFAKIQSNAKLVIAGQATDSAYLKKCHKFADNSIIFAGFLPYEDLLKCYATADVFVTGTLWEGFNLPLLEAQASGTPVVAFNHCSHPEVVKNGETGYLTKPFDIPDMVKGFEKAYRNSEELSKNARGWAQKFSLEIYAKNLNMYIYRVLEKENQK
jgi:1,2-diacylglycerol 3-alpha-glucosyltransferase